MIFDPILDLFRGKAITIPPLDGAFRPDTRLDEADLFCELREVDNLVFFEERVVGSSGNAILELKAGAEPSLLEAFEAPVTALAVLPDGGLAVALETGRLLIDGKPAELPAGIACITALAVDRSGTLWLANGSAEHSPSDWASDLMTHGASGSVWKRAVGATAFERVAGGLAFPYGLLPDGDGVVVSESWRHRLVRVTGSGGVEPVVEHIPGYPARIAPASGGGAWLSVFAPRNRLIEFVLQEGRYRLDMMAEVPRAQWIAPAFSSGRSFLEPLQCGGIKTMGIHKPWAPSRSYGLLVRLDSAMQPVESYHSRANGSRHGICSALEAGGRVLAASRGGDCVLAIPLNAPEGR
ncbi:hypothetical protein M8R20_04820 [Pseudomonas sp. R2.Fl]|nr:hypothetical protein [Pseudomonas sp. R2.Fl]